MYDKDSLTPSERKHLEETMEKYAEALRLLSKGD